MNKLQDTYQQVCNDIAAAEQRLAGLRLQKEALERAGATETPASEENPAIASANGKTKAPSGQLTAAILKAIGEGAGTNGAIRKALTVSGYTFSLEPTHISKTLQRLAKNKLIHGRGPKTARTYTLVKK